MHWRIRRDGARFPVCAFIARRFLGQLVRFLVAYEPGMGWHFVQVYRIG
jgi:hypothetical protein